MYTFGERRLAALSTQLDDIMVPVEKSELILEISNEDAGWISVFDTPCPTPVYGGLWYNNIPVKIQAHAKPGWKFIRWIGSHPSEENVLSINLDENIILHAVFEPYELPSIMISEIHYNPSEELQGADEDFEFLELFNNEQEQVNISGYRFTEGIDFTFPQGSFMGAGECIILAANPEEIYTPEGIQVYHISSGKLDNAGELLCLRDHQNMIIDQVYFDDHYPWPRKADGEGPSLELIDPWLDNGLASSWKASEQTGGSPGSGIHTGMKEMDPYSHKDLLLDIYPNPFHLNTYIRYSIIEEGRVTIRIFNVNGQEVDRLIREKQSAGIHEIEWIPDNLPYGVYFLQMNAGGDNLHGKVLYLKMNCAN